MFDGHFQYLRNTQVSKSYVQDLSPKSLPIAILTFQLNVGHKLHIDCCEPKSIAGWTPSKITIKTKVSDIESPRFRVWRLGKHSSNFVHGI